jgi:type II secretory pathway component GspD/PulD (secretin)
MRPFLIASLAAWSGLLLGDLAAAESFPDQRLPLFDLNRVKVSEAARLLGEASGLNVVASSAAAAKEVDLRLRDVSVEQAVRTLCATTGLWYRLEGDSTIVRLMTIEEFSQGLSPFPVNTTRTITLLYPKAELVGEQIAHIYGSRVELQVGEQQPLSTPKDRQGTGSGNNGEGTNATGQSNKSGGKDTNKSGSGNVGGKNSDGLENGKLTAEAFRTGVPNGVADAVTALRRETPALPPIALFVNRTDNLISVRSRDTGALDEIEHLIRDLDRPTPQVLLQVRILSVQLGDDFRSTFDLQLAGDSTVEPGAVQAPGNPYAAANAGAFRQAGGLGNFPAEGGTAVYQFLTGSLRARIQLLASQNRVNTLSSPLLMGAHARTTELSIGEDRLVVTGFSNSTTTTTTGTTGGLFATTQRRNIGTDLDIVPYINADRTVDIAVQLAISTVNPSSQAIQVIDSQSNVQSLAVDTVNQSRVEGSVVVGDSQTIAIGGLIREGESETQSKVPLLGDIPVLGWFFRRQVTSKSRTELIILVTPLVISVPGDGAALVGRRLEALSLNPRLFDERPSKRYRVEDLESPWQRFPLGLPQDRSALPGSPGDGSTP